MKKIVFFVLGILLINFLPVLTACSPQISTQIPDIINQPIPPSMKGYEIFSWKEEGEWVFKLMTGTNRQKSIEEIMSDSEKIQDNNWINIKIYGVDELKKILSNLPNCESLFWVEPNRIESTTGQTIPLTYPDDAMMDEIHAFCEQYKD